MPLPSMMAKERFEKRQSAVRAAMNTAPLSGVLLAILFVVSSGVPMHLHGRVHGNLPEVRNALSEPGAARDDALLVSVMRDGQAFFRASRASPEELEAQIRSGLLHGAEKKVYLRVDKRAMYADVISVLECVRKAGIQDISFITE